MKSTPHLLVETCARYACLMLNRILLHAAHETSAAMGIALPGRILMLAGCWLLAVAVGCCPCWQQLLLPAAAGQVRKPKLVMLLMLLLLTLLLMLLCLTPSAAAPITAATTAVFGPALKPAPLDASSKLPPLWLLTSLSLKMHSHVLHASLGPLLPLAKP